jgi:hypothetical protein
MTKTVVMGFQVGLLMGLTGFHEYAGESKVRSELAEFIFETAPFRECHASTILELPSGELLAAWFGGEGEGDNSVRIWMSRKLARGAWSFPEAMTGIAAVAYLAAGALLLIAILAFVRRDVERMKRALAAQTAAPQKV